MSKKVRVGDVDIDIPDISPGKILGIGGFIVIAIILFSSFYTVDANENGVVLRFGKYSRTTTPGLHFKLPWGIEEIYKIKVAYQYKQEYGFRTTQPGVRTRYDVKGRYENESWMFF